MEFLGERVLDLAEDIVRGDSEQFRIDARDFLSAMARGGTTGIRIDEQTAALSDAAEIFNRSLPTLEPSRKFINAIWPVVIPNHRSLFWRLMPAGMMVVFFFVGAGDARPRRPSQRGALFGQHNPSRETYSVSATSTSSPGSRRSVR